jgi:hypothetical protein
VTNTRIPKVGEKGWTAFGEPVEVVAVRMPQAWVIRLDGVGEILDVNDEMTPPPAEPIGYANIYPWDHPRDHDVARIGAQSAWREIVDNQAADGRIAVLVWWADGNVTVEATP